MLSKPELRINKSLVGFHSANVLMRELTHSFSAGYFFIRPGGNVGNGTNNNVYNYDDSAGNTYHRKVDAALNLITYDEESGTLGTQASRSHTTSGFDRSGGQQIRLPHGRRVPSL